MGWPGGGDRTGGSIKTYALLKDAAKLKLGFANSWPVPHGDVFENNPGTMWVGLLVKDDPDVTRRYVKPNAIGNYKQAIFSEFKSVQQERDTSFE